MMHFPVREKREKLSGLPHLLLDIPVGRKLQERLIHKHVKVDESVLFCDPSDLLEEAFLILIKKVLYRSRGINDIEHFIRPESIDIVNICIDLNAAVSRQLQCLSDTVVCQIKSGDFISLLRHIDSILAFAAAYVQDFLPGRRRAQPDQDIAEISRICPPVKLIALIPFLVISPYAHIGPSIKVIPIKSLSYPV